MRLEEALHGRRSIRRFADRQPPSDLLPDLVAAACTAPAPHHSRPWRFIMIESSEKQRALIKEMLRAWRLDLEKDGVAASRIDELAARTRRRLTDAPLLLLACLLEDRMRRWPDERRQRAEREMYLHSVGAAVQNLMLAAHARGVASYQMGSPLFCPEAVRHALDLPDDHDPQALVALGYPEPNTAPPSRPQASSGDALGKC